MSNDSEFYFSTSDKETIIAGRTKKAEAKAHFKRLRELGVEW